LGFGGKPDGYLIMGKIVISEFVTLDGVMQDPGGTGELKEGGWAMLVSRGPKGDKFKLDELFSADVMLLGRVTYESFAKARPNMQRDETGYADRMNSLPKYVVSTTLKQPYWNNSYIISENVAEEIGMLKARTGRDILVFGSGILVKTLMEMGLADEYRLLVYPVVLGRGKHLFNDTWDRLNLKLIKSEIF
jgi:dihydrofolate reductase